MTGWTQLGALLDIDSFFLPEDYAEEQDLAPLGSLTKIVTLAGGPGDGEVLALPPQFEGNDLYMDSFDLAQWAAESEGAEIPASRVSQHRYHLIPIAGNPISDTGEMLMYGIYEGIG